MITYQPYPSPSCVVKLTTRAFRRGTISRVTWAAIVRYCMSAYIVNDPERS